MKAPIRSTSSKLLILLSCLVFFVGCAPDPRPNVLFIGIDDLNDWIEPLGGHASAITPNLAALASRSYSFTNAQAASPSCNPSRTSLLTGLHPLTTGVVANQQGDFRQYIPTAKTMITQFEEEGYDMACFGKLYHGAEVLNEEWDEFDWCQSQPDFEDSVHHGISYLTDSLYFLFDWAVSDSSLDQWGGHLATNKTIAFLEAANHAPFFLSTGLTSSHIPWYVPRRFFDLYDSLQIELPDSTFDDLADLPQFALDYTKQARKGHQEIIVHDKREEAIRFYLAAISFLDWEIGRILESLENSKHADNTIVVVWSDHGFHLGEKQVWKKNTLWEESCRIPLLIQLPGDTISGKQVGTPVSLVDLYPTLIDLCSLQPRDDLDGLSLVRLLKNPVAEFPRDYVISTNAFGSTIRSRRWRYIQYLDGSEELYDHDVDEGELVNLSQRKEHFQILLEFRKALTGKS